MTQEHKEQAFNQHLEKSVKGDSGGFKDGYDAGYNRAIDDAIEKVSKMPPDFHRDWIDREKIVELLESLKVKS